MCISKYLSKTDSGHCLKKSLYEINVLIKIQNFFHVSPCRLVNSHGPKTVLYWLHTAQHRTGLDSSSRTNVTTSAPAHSFHASGYFNSSRIPVHSGTIMTRPWAERRLAIRVRSSTERQRILGPPKCHEENWGPPVRLSEMHHGLFAMVSSSWTITALGVEFKIAWNFTSTTPHVSMH